MFRTPFADTRSQFLAGRFGIMIFVVSLGILFASTLIGFLVMRLQIGLKDQWPALPALPHVLWLSTLVIVSSSATMQHALLSIRRGNQQGLRTGLVATVTLGLVFLSLQSVAWVQWVTPVAERWGESSEWRFALTSFYVFTGLHAAHVVGGLIPMSIVTLRASRHGYTQDRHAGVEYSALYWHFLDAVWLALFATLLIGV